MITFIDITESILYIRNKSKQKVSLERLLIQLKNKEQYEDLALFTLEKEISTLTEAGMLAMIMIPFLSTMFLIRQEKNKLSSIRKAKKTQTSIILQFLIRQQKNKLSSIRKAKKTQTSIILQNVHQQMTLLSLMKIYQLLQIGLKLY